MRTYRIFFTTGTDVPNGSHLSRSAGKRDPLFLRASAEKYTSLRAACAALLNNAWPGCKYTLARRDGYGYRAVMSHWEPNWEPDWEHWDE